MTASDAARTALAQFRKALPANMVMPRVREIGRVRTAGDGIAVVAGLPRAQSQELVEFPNAVRGLVFNLDETELGCVLLSDDTAVAAGDLVRRTGTVVQTPVGHELLGRVLDPLGTPLDGGPALQPELYSPVEREAPPILARDPVTRPLATGIKSVDSMIPIGRGQRELIIGDRSTGKTTIALNAILNQTDGKVICVYVAIGQRASTVARVVETLREHGALQYTIVVVADADAPSGMRFIAPYAGCAISEFFAERGHDTLIVYDDLTKHAQTYREISLLLRRPPGREAYPGDIFYLHSRLLERAAQWDQEHDSGSQTALPIVETQAQNISAYIPTNLISITDGQIYMNPELFQAGFLPAVDIGLSVSRVGGKTQLPAMKTLAQAARLDFTQFLELEKFAKFGTTLEAHTQAILDKGQRLRELLNQGAFAPVPLPEQVLVLHLARTDVLLDVPVAAVPAFEARFRETVRERAPELLAKINAGKTLEDSDTEAVLGLAKRIAASFRETDPEPGTDGGETEAVQADGDGATNDTDESQETDGGTSGTRAPAGEHSSIA